ncbi:MAG TPA: RidA family protein [Candidatus Avipropionibacterium avicola]|uniref:RidA family protein n=1 Tax=Candidatus Avipropionibacterium avicola TaxID=2840701 RepID=A0A9D1H1U5_9ACTN|nr:RidA family protein [Candidatus Avipropionibacterium avicola]
MTRSVIHTADAPPPAGPYSQGVLGGGLFFTAGFGPQDPETGEVAETVGEQTRQVLRNVEAALKAQGLSLDDVVKVTAYLQHLKRDFEEYNAVYGDVFAQPYPARTTVGAELYDILVEIDVVAVAS